ncbi:DUF1758 domain-containing protein [Trichonephila clavipes]|nr:DUF1758 domain-containing protein [Trichonephila clavipes]
MKKGPTETRCLQIRYRGMKLHRGRELAQRLATSEEFKGQAGESEIYSGASVNSELKSFFLPTANVKVKCYSLTSSRFLVKFRLDEIAFSADIQQMYRQILIDQEDQNFQRIVWRESKDSPIREYKLCTESFYIDDLMAGAPSSEEAISLIKTLSNILEARGFHLRKWRSNSSEVLSRISSNWVGDSSNLEIHPDECSKALGLTWNSMKDIFIFNLKVNFPDNITKRSFLSQSARLFDPLGFLTPCTVSIKIFFYQQLWLLKLDWDSPLPEALATKWKTFQKEFEQVSSIHIPRWIHTASQQITLHGFCDASELAYASIIYAVQPQADGNTKVTLLVAKSRVAPLKSVSIPRLELNGALLLARLYATCKNILKEYDIYFYAWTDSQVVLSWLSSHPRNWKPYIANRTSEILDLVPADSWRYVPTKMIPADIACRGLSPKELPTCVLWYRATTSKQLMGDLPTHRVTPSRPFSVCVVDYAGPINILRYRGRGAKTTKGYIALFVCFVTKALHLELVSDLTSEAFIASLKRFCARRGAPKHIYCDNGEVITSSPEHTNEDKLSLRSRWDIVQKMKLGFWRKWKIDYLSNLQTRTKWKCPNNNFKVGEIVIIKEDNIPPATWPLGKVIETHPGKDSVVRVLTLRTVKGRFKRPIHKLCKLPLHQE